MTHQTARRRWLPLTIVAALLVFGSGAALGQGLPLVPGWDFGGDAPSEATPPPDPDQVIANLPTDQATPLIANGVSVGKHVELYFSSGIGPAARNTAAPAGTPERYLDPAQLPGGLTGGVTVTEAQGLNALARINTNLESGETLAVPLGTGSPGPPMVVNPVRPSRTALEIGSLPVAGWLVEIEVVARR